MDNLKDVNPVLIAILSLIGTFVSVCATVFLGYLQIKAKRRTEAAEAAIKEANAAGDLVDASGRLVTIQDGTIVKLHTQMQALDAKVNEMTENYEAVKGANAVLANRADVAEQSNKVLTDKVTRLETSNAQLIAANAKLKVELSESRLESAKAQSDAAEAKVETQELRSRNTELEKEIEQLYTQLGGKVDKKEG